MILPVVGAERKIDRCCVQSSLYKEWLDMEWSESLADGVAFRIVRNGVGSVDAVEQVICVSLEGIHVKNG